MNHEQKEFVCKLFIKPIYENENVRIFKMLVGKKNVQWCVKYCVLFIKLMRLDFNALP